MTQAKPTWVRETLCEDLADIDRAAGRVPDTRAIERIVDNDLATYEAQLREQKAPTKYDTDGTLKTAEGYDYNDPAPDMARAAGASFYRADGEATERKVRQAPTFSGNFCACNAAGTCKQCKLIARITLCLSHRGGRPRDTVERDGVEFTAPALAKDVLRQYWAHKMGALQYRGKGSVDRDRIYARALEDIADRSTAVFGPWWVK